MKTPPSQNSLANLSLNNGNVMKNKFRHFENFIENINSSAVANRGTVVFINNNLL
jgi:hypothetical protein